MKAVSVAVVNVLRLIGGTGGGGRGVGIEHGGQEGTVVHEERQNGGHFQCGQHKG